MKTYRKKGSMTVFLSLISVLFLSLLCTSIESARIQGARAKAAAALDMGNFSLFGEFENELLEKYDIFALDGACGTGYYSTSALEWKLVDYMQYNTSPNTGLLFKGFDPFQVQLDAAKIERVALLTDQDGNAFYQQAVGFMHDNFAMEAVDLWLERKNEAEKLQTAARDYENQENSNSQDLTNLQQEQQEKEARLQEELEHARKEAQANGVVWEDAAEKDKKEVKNPLEIIKEIRKKGIYGLILGEGTSLSKKTIPQGVVSKRKRKTGTLPVKKKYSGLASDLLFQEYLFERFARYGQSSTGNYMDYELEYILYGKNADERNLKEAIKTMLWLREGANFLFLCSDGTRKQEADALSAVIAGAIPVPGLTTALSYALLLVWAYAESVLDLRILMTGGKLPIWKDAASWHLDLQDIPDILNILNNPTKFSSKEGLTYEGYLQILFMLGKKSSYPLRTLDLIEGHMKQKGYTGFCADQAIVKMETSAKFTIPALFMRVPNAFLNTGIFTAAYSASGTFSYLE